MSQKRPLADRISEVCGTKPHQSLTDLCGILAEPSGTTKTGYPYISSHAFQTFLARVPHLFQNGHLLLEWLHFASDATSNTKNFSTDEKSDIIGSLKVLSNVTKTAAITSPTDLWLLRHVLAAFDSLSLLHRDTEQVFVQTSKHPERFEPFIVSSLDFLISRRLIEKVDSEKYLPPSHAARLTLQAAWDIPDEHRADMVPACERMLQGLNSSAEVAECDRFLQLTSAPRPHLHWTPSENEINIGFRLVPLVLAIHQTTKDKPLVNGQPVQARLPNISEAAVRLLQAAGVLDQTGKITALGHRIFTKGPGPFGIIYAYHSYMKNLPNILQKGLKGVWVERSANVAASQEANSNTFKMANDQLDEFCRDFNFSYSVFIEHAVGQGEATRQRFLRNGNSLKYFGADLETAAIAAAKRKQAEGELPASMQFVDQADIGKAEVLLNALKLASVSPRGVVMIVGNGFHEIRNQSDESMAAVFKDYSNAGLILIFTEESGLSNEDLATTAWNTYHAGFRYVHELSGQGLRPAIDTEEEARLSWRRCAEKGGYIVMDKYCAKTRTIYPHPRPDGKNPSISVTYFCVPSELAVILGIKAGAESTE